MRKLNLQFFAGVSTDTYRINVENAAYALIESNTTLAYSLKNKKPLPGLRSIDLTLQLASGKLYGDGSIACNIAQATGATLKVDVNKIKIENRAEILGQTYSSGVLDVKAGDSAPEIAFYFEVISDKGTKEQLWLLCGVAQPFGMTGAQREENITFSTDTMTIEFKPRAIDKKIQRLGDTSNADFTTVHSVNFANNPDALSSNLTATLNPESFNKYASSADYKDVVLTLNTGNILYIKANGDYIPAASISVSGYVATIKKEFLATLEVGEVVMTVYTDVGDVSKILVVTDSTP